MIRMILIISFLLTAPCIASMKSKKEVGKKWAKQEAITAFDQGKKFDAKDLLSAEDKDKKFDAKEAYKKVEKGENPHSETVNFLMSEQVQMNQQKKSFHQDELFIKTSEEIFIGNKEDQFNQLEDVGYTYHTCKQGGDPFLVVTERNLHVDVNHVAGKVAKVCSGHKQEIGVMKKGSIEETVKKLRKKYKSDPTIKAKSVEVKFLHAHPTSLLYFFQVYYEHVDNSEGCGQCKDKQIKEESHEEVGEEWIYDNQELWNLSKSHNSTIMEHVCLDSTPIKKVKGKAVNRQCWKEKISFLYQFPSSNDCNFLKAKNCEQIKQECIHFESSTCTQWQLTFRCYDTIKLSPVSFEYDPGEEKIEYTPNQSFSEVAAKLAVFEEVKKEMENSQAIDVTNLEVFKGKRMSCSKNVADNVMYDCCFSYSGLAEQMGFAKCNADEIGLAEMREKGLCYYVGNYEEKFLDIWKSRDEHVFCCFPTKLSRIVQEQGRKQLEIEWGSAKEPNCRGFTTDELARVDFSKMNLSEICEGFVKKMSDDMPDRLKGFQNRLKQDIEKSEAGK